MLKYLVLVVFLFLCGITGLFLTRKYIILWLLSLELIFLSISLNFLTFSVYLDDLLGQYYVLCILVIAASESAIGLSILVIFYRLRGGISLDLINLLKG